MELRNINTFLHIAELHSFSSAARELGYSQPRSHSWKQSLARPSSTG